MENQDIPEIAHIKIALKDRLLYIANNIANFRHENIEYELESVMAVLTQLFYHIDVSAVLDKVKESYDMLICLNTEDNIHERATLDLVYTSRRGRPYFNIPEETLVYFIEKGFSLKTMSKMLSVCEKTIVNRMADYGLSIRASYSSLCDEELASIVRRKIEEFPSVGYKSMQGHLRADGIRITEARLRRVMRAVDPLGVLLRNVFCQTYRIRRRTYSVRAPMALWHVDTNHKLIRLYILSILLFILY